MKTIDQVWDVYLKKNGKVDESSLGELRWHIEHDEYPWDAISMAADMIVENQSSLMKKILVPAMVKQLYSESSSTRQFAVGAIRRLMLPQYGQELYRLSTEDAASIVRIIATNGLGDIMNEVEKPLAKKMATYLYEILRDNDFEHYCKSHRDSASDSVLSAMDYDYLAFPRAWNDPDFDPIWKDFVKKYKLEYKPVFRR